VYSAHVDTTGYLQTFEGRYSCIQHMQTPLTTVYEDIKGQVSPYPAHADTIGFVKTLEGWYSSHADTSEYMKTFEGRYSCIQHMQTGYV
jgi:hypothetical protein